ncbi:MAG: anaerobic glycerol-3-phosphate dehydrogenase subunit B [Deltaproteobacteria bacterium]|nr:anaerobic glycerol-3-phosphate dehydrogenase subunit B [Deltaproteobacteria bacterium]MBW2595632.1 anaerobic glycerol-3-phosphate dehydrogenase subunit B [Deltaproteobacteria bacterium]MBW2649573.1 anaerobic glycerol-3-phosphate dehydrogenase subunit B [Deltaproteobacteria bacterium]
MSGTYDVVIIGGGMSGMMAAIALADMGRKIAVVSKGDPVCCLSTGCIDLLATDGDPLKGVGSLPDNHPYHLVGEDAIRESLEMFRDIMSEGGMPYVGDARVNRRILTPLGRRKVTCLVPGTMEFADFHSDEYIHVISFKKMKDFYPDYITSRYKNAGYSIFDAGIATTAGIAEQFENRKFLEGFISWLKGLDIPEGRIAIPAVLGMRFAGDVCNEISAKLGRNVFEIPTLPPSVPGLRLFGGLKKALLKRGGDLYWGREIYSVEKLGNQIEAVTLAGAGRSARVQGNAFILATGSFVSGGLHTSMDAVEETVFDLPAYLPGGRESWFNDDFFAPGHAIEKSGICVDPFFRPVDPQFENLFVCGSILAFSEIMKYRCGHGMAIATGVAAAKACGRPA